MTRPCRWIASKLPGWAAPGEPAWNGVSAWNVAGFYLNLCWWVTFSRWVQRADYNLCWRFLFSPCIHLYLSGSVVAAYIIAPDLFGLNDSVQRQETAFGVGGEKGEALLGNFLASSSALESSQAVFTPVFHSLKDWRLAEAWQGATWQSNSPFLWAVPKCLEQNQEFFFALTSFNNAALLCCFSRVIPQKAKKNQSLHWLNFSWALAHWDFVWSIKMKKKNQILKSFSKWERKKISD